MRGSNVESKVRCERLVDVTRRAHDAGARYEGSLRQTDRYFEARRGRLKLREIVHTSPDGHISRSAELIRYRRPDVAGARVSAYERTEVGDADSMARELTAEHGLRGVVEKQRELWILDSTRIHLDRVEGLGDFVELETVARGEAGAAEREEHDRISRALGLERCAAVEGSYIDLVSARRPAARARSS